MSTSRTLSTLAAVAVMARAVEYVTNVDYGALAQCAYTFVEDAIFPFSAEGCDPYRLMFMCGATLGAYRYRQHRGEAVASDVASSDDDDDDESNVAAQIEVVPNLFAQRLELIAYTEEVPTHYQCTITREIMHDPVVAADAKCYERSALKAFFVVREDKQLPIVSPDNPELKMGKKMMRVGAFKSQIEGFVRLEELKYLSGTIQSLRGMFFRDANGKPVDEKSTLSTVASDEAIHLITGYVGLRR